MSLTEAQIKELKQDLLHMLDRLQEGKDKGKPSIKNETGELSYVDNHLADTASGIVNREKEIAEDSFKEDEMEEIEAALERIQEGTYGICVDTGNEISYERLKAVPYAKRTVEAEEARTRGTREPDGGATSRLQKPEGEMADSKNRTLETIEEEHRRR